MHYGLYCNFSLTVVLVHCTVLNRALNLMHLYDTLWFRLVGNAVCVLFAAVNQKLSTFFLITVPYNQERMLFFNLMCYDLLARSIANIS